MLRSSFDVSLRRKSRKTRAAVPARYISVEDTTVEKLSSSPSSTKTLRHPEAERIIFSADSRSSRWSGIPEEKGFFITSFILKILSCTDDIDFTLCTISAAVCHG